METSRIGVTLYAGHLPVAWGHLEPDQGRMWLAVAVAAGWTGKHYGSGVVLHLLAQARAGGFDVWITCPRRLVGWYARFGFKVSRWRPTPRPARGQVVMARRRAR